MVSSAEGEVIPCKPNLIRRLYDWVTGWAETPYGPIALMILAFAESSFFPVPPDVLLVALGIGRPKRSFYYAFLCTVGSVAGAVLGYVIGYAAWESLGQPIVDFYHGQEIVERIRSLYLGWGFWGVLFAAITPIPYKVFTISSGLFALPMTEFLAASIIGRSIRFFLVGGLIYHFGAPIKRFIEKYFNLVVIVFTVLLIGGFVVLKYIK